MAKIAFIGLGNMGGPMAANLVKAQHQVTAFDLSAPAVDGRGREGRAQGGVGRRSGEGRRDRRHHAAGRQACARGLREGRAAQRRQGRAADRLLDHRRRQRPPCRRRWRQKAGLEMVDAPVSGGVGGATAGTLTFMVGGSDAAFAKARPILEKMGKNIVHAGASGSGQAAKICNNMILGISMIARQRRLHAGQAPGPRRAEAVRRRVDVVGPCWSLVNYLPGAGPGADLARQPRLPGGLHRGDDAEGPDAGAAGGATRRAPARRSAPRPRSSSACSSTAAMRRQGLLRHHQDARRKVRPP